MATDEAKQATQILLGYIAHCTSGRPEDAEALVATIDDPILWRKLALISMRHAAQFFAETCAAAGRDPAEVARQLAVAMAARIENDPDL